MNIENRINKLSHIKRVPAPPDLYERIEGRLLKVSNVSKAVAIAAFIALAVISTFNIASIIQLSRTTMETSGITIEQIDMHLGNHLYNE